MEQEKSQYDFMVNLQRRNQGFKSKRDGKPEQRKGKNKVVVEVESEEEEIEEQDMEPAGDLSVHAEEVRQYALQFSGVAELNYQWLRGKQGEKKECYDDLACMCLEWNYWQYLKGGPSQEKHRFVQCMPHTIVDMQCLCETDVHFNETGVEAERRDDEAESEGDEDQDDTQS